MNPFCASLRQSEAAAFRRQNHPRAPAARGVQCVAKPGRFKNQNSATKSRNDIVMERPVRNRICFWCADKLTATYILTVDKGKTPEQDDFYKFYLRAQARGWPVFIMEGDHNVQRSHSRELVKLLERAP